VDQQPDFQCLVSCKNEVCKAIGLDSAHFQLSMGMSSDYQKAIELGSTSVRVGSLIFGSR